MSTITTEGELTKDTMFEIPPGNPIGLGFRVPLMIVSPWTRGGYVYSEVADHTSTIKFLEKRFGIECPNISPWRRAITGDLTQAFNFTHPDYTWPKLPKTTGDWIRTRIECAFEPPPEVPKIQKMPVQEQGTKKSRALDYHLDATMTYEGGDNLLLKISS